MRLLLFFLSTWFTTAVMTPDDPEIRINRTTTNEQIKEAERQIWQQYGAKAEIKVMARNAKGEITGLKFIRYAKDKSGFDSCQSDNFNSLIVTKTGCQIRDNGTSKEL